MRLAAPSCVIPGTVAENADALAACVAAGAVPARGGGPRVPACPAASDAPFPGLAEIALCFFEAEACAAYGDDDLPPRLAALPFAWHAHLPVDLDWSRGGAAAADRARYVLDRASFLAPRAAVLHAPELPPELASELTRNPARDRAPDRAAPGHAAPRARSVAQLLADFARRWYARGGPPLLLENTASCDVACLGADFPATHGLGFCLDAGHLLGYAQHRLLASSLPERAALVHWSAPGPVAGRDRHLALDALTPAQAAVARALLARVPAGATHLLEVFSLEGVAASVACLARWAAAR